MASFWFTTFLRVTFSTYAFNLHWSPYDASSTLSLLYIRCIISPYSTAWLDGLIFFSIHSIHAPWPNCLACFTTAVMSFQAPPEQPFNEFELVRSLPMQGLRHPADQASRDQSPATPMQPTPQLILPSVVALLPIWDSQTIRHSSSRASPDHSRSKHKPSMGLHGIAEWYEPSPTSLSGLGWSSDLLGAGGKSS